MVRWYGMCHEHVQSIAANRRFKMLPPRMRNFFRSTKSKRDPVNAGIQPTCSHLKSYNRRKQLQIDDFRHAVHGIVMS